MNTIKMTGIFLTTLFSASVVVANTVTFTGANSQFQCKASTAYNEKIIDANVPTVRIDTHTQNVKGLCAGGNSINGKLHGEVTSNGHLVHLPIWWKDNDRSVITLNDICFSAEGVKGLWDYKDGSVEVSSETGATSISCHTGCVGTTQEFGVGGYC